MSVASKVVTNPKELDQQILKVMIPVLKEYNIHIDKKINNIEEIVKIAKNNLDLKFQCFVVDVLVNCKSIYQKITYKQSLCKRLSEIFNLDYKLVENTLQELVKINSKSKLLNRIILVTISIGFMINLTIGILNTKNLMLNLILFLIINLPFIIICSFYIFYRLFLNDSKEFLINILKKPSNNIFTK